MSKRLNALASLVDTNNVFDVGCDHGLLSIMLSDTHNVVASDITPSSVNIAKKNIKEANVNVEVVQSDGLDKLDIKKDDTIILAGMGTYTIMKILKNNIDKVSNTLIIQANNNLDILRRNIVKLGYYIDSEITLYENRWYTLIRFKKGHVKYRKIDYILGPNPNIDYIKFNLDIYKKMYNKIPNRYFIKKINTYLIIKTIERKLHNLM